jgi:hypothetical protein
VGYVRYRVSAAEDGAAGVVVNAAGCGMDLLVVGEGEGGYVRETVQFASVWVAILERLEDWNVIIGG